MMITYIFPPRIAFFLWNAIWNILSSGIKVIKLCQKILWQPIGDFQLNILRK